MKQSQSRRQRVLKALRRGGADERGAVMVIAAVLTALVFLPLAALSIDIPSYDQAQRQAQAAADAGALAASQDLPGTAGSASTDATTYAQKNFPGATVSVTINTVSQAATVTVIAATPTFFGKLMGAATKTVTATAVASETNPPTSCKNAGNACDAVFAADQTCSSNPPLGVFFNGGGYNILGGVHSNGSLNTGGGGSSFGPTTYGPGNGCLSNNGNAFTSGPTAEAPIPTWPSGFDYSTDFPACGGTGTACNSSGTPSYCSASAANFTFTNSSPPSSGYIYCAYGTGTKSNPSAQTGGGPWNGTITFSGGSIGSSGNPVVASYIAGNVYTGSGGEYFQACGYSTSGYNKGSGPCTGASGQTMPSPATYNYPLIYALDTSANVPNGSQYSVYLGGGGNSWTGDIFAPNGSIVVAAGSQPVTFLEAQDVGFISGGITGDGAASSGGASPSGGSESLLQ